MAYGGYEANGGTAARRHRAIKILLAGGFGVGKTTLVGAVSGAGARKRRGPWRSRTSVRRGRHGTDDVPVVTGVPVGRPTSGPDRNSTSSRRSGGPIRTVPETPTPRRRSPTRTSAAGRRRLRQPVQQRSRGKRLPGGGAPFQDSGVAAASGA